MAQTSSVAICWHARSLVTIEESRSLVIEESRSLGYYAVMMLARSSGSRCLALSAATLKAAWILLPSGSNGRLDLG